MNQPEPVAATRPTVGGNLLAAIDATTDLDYITDGTHTGPSSSAQTIVEAINRLRVIGEQLDIAWCGAAIAAIFLKRPWLHSITVEITAESQFSDEGGTYMSRTIAFSGAIAVAGATVPPELRTPDGELDSDALADELREEHDDSAWDFGLPFLEPGQGGEVTLLPTRDQLAPVLSRPGAISGIEAARLLWPDHGALRARAG